MSYKGLKQPTIPIYGASSLYSGASGTEPIQAACSNDCFTLGVAALVQLISSGSDSNSPSTATSLTEEELSPW